MCEGSYSPISSSRDSASGYRWGLGAQANRYTQIFLFKRQAALAQSSNQKSCWCDGAATRAAQPDFSTWIAKGDHQHTMRTETRAGSPHGLLLVLPSEVCPQPLLLTAASSRYGSQRHCSVCSAKSHIPTRSLLTDACARCGFTPCFSTEPPGFAAVGSFGAHSPCQRPPHLL